MTAAEWGDPGHYYAHSPEAVSESTDGRAMASRLRPLLNECLPETEERVRRAVKVWNQSVRDQLRAETALRLSAGEQPVAVPVRVTDGVPPPLWRLSELPDPILRLSLMRGTITSAVRGVRLVREHLPDVVGVVAPEMTAGDRVPSQDDLRQVEGLLELLAVQLRRVNVLDEIDRASAPRRRPPATS